MRHLLLTLASACAFGGEPFWRDTLLIQLNVADLGRSIRFYTDTLGFRVTEVREDLGFAHIATGMAGLEIGLSKSEKPVLPGTVIFNFGIKGDIEQVRKTLEAKGVRFLGPTHTIPGKVRLAAFRDPDGYVLRLAASPGDR
jgi:catechol 2,3-dioxygenase-like lactoylglutathione lyase family enzyme